MLLPDAPVSIDIGSFSVKVAQVQGGRAGARSLRFAEQRLPEGFHWEAGGSTAPLVAALRQALREAGIRSRRALLALPRRHVIMRVSALPSAERAQLQRVVEVELADHIPFPVDQVVIDFQPLGPSRERPGLTDVLVVAAPRDLVRQYLDLARALGMKVAALTVDSFALHDLASLHKDGAPGMRLTMELGRRATTINVSDGTRLRLSRAVPLGSQQLSAALRDDLELSAEEAEIRRLADGLNVLATTPRATRVRAWLDNLCGEIRRTALSFGQETLLRIDLAGAGAHTPGLAQALQAEFGVTPVVLSPVSLFPTAHLQGPDTTAGDRCLLALGMGLRGLGKSAFTISLLPREVSAARRLAVGQRAAVVASLALLGLTTWSYFTAQERVQTLRRADTAAKKVVQAVDAKTHAAAELDQTMADLTRDLRELEPARARRYAALELLKVISETASPDIILTRFALRAEQPLLVDGIAPTPAAAADLQAALLRSPLVTRVSLDRADQVLSLQSSPYSRAPRPTPTSAGAPAETRVNFTLTVHLRTEKAPKAKRTLGGAVEGARP